MFSVSKATTNRFRAPVLLLCTLCFIAAVPLSAAAINLTSVGLFNTGVNNSGVALGAAAADTHWQCSVNCSGNSFQAQANTVAGQPFAGWPLPSTQNGTGSAAGPWVASATSGGSPLSQWISFQANVNSEPNTTTEYDYTETFNLSGFVGTSFELVGSFAVDNAILGLLINGNVVTGTNGGSYGTSGAKTAFDITNASCSGGCGLTNGTNTITFRTENVQFSSPNPTGLLVEYTSATANPTAPEPATLFGVGLGLSALGLIYRRRRG